MKRRISDIATIDQDSSIHQTTDSELSQSDTASERKVYKAKRKATEIPPQPVSESFLKMIKVLQDPDLKQKTDDELAKKAELEKASPRKIIAEEKKDYSELKKAEVKLRILEKDYGKGEVKLIKVNEKNSFIVIFRSPIGKVLFSWPVSKESKVEFSEVSCKEKHGGKKDLVLRFKTEGEKVALCGLEKDIQEIGDEITKVIDQMLDLGLIIKD